MLVFPAMAFAEVVSADGTTGSSLPSITSDKADYAPGDLVTLTGSNWQPGESVHIVVNDTYGATWQHTADVTADPTTGDITDSFNLPNTFVSDYDVTATGSSGSVATTTFTDAINTTTTLTRTGSNPSTAGTAVGFTATVTCSQTCSFNSGQSIDLVDNGNSNNCGGGTVLATVPASSFTGSGLSRTATFSHAFTSAGTKSLRACFNGGGSNPTAGSSVSDPPLSHTVNPAAASKLGFTSQPTNTVAGTSISPAPAVTVQDAFGNSVTSSNASVTMALGSGSPAGTLSGTKTVNAVNGVATFPDLSIDNVNSGYTLAATSGSLTSATSDAFNTTKRVTNTTVSCSPSQLGFAQQSKCTATVTDTSAGTASAPTGNVNWSRSGSTGVFSSTSCTLSASGTDSSKCSVNYTPNGTGTHTDTITANYQLGDAKHLADSGTTTVRAAALTATTLTVDPKTATEGDATVSLSATLKAGTTNVANRSVSFELDGNPVGSATTNTSGVATLNNVNISAFQVGSYPINATFNGDTSGTITYNGSTGSSTLTVTPSNTAPAATLPNFTPASPKTNDTLQASTTTTDAENNNVSVAWVWKVTRGANTCQVKTDASLSAAPGARSSSLDLSQSYNTSNCTGTTPPASINPSKGDTVVADATPNDGSVNGTTRSNSVAIANSAPTCAAVNLTTNEDTTGSTSPNCTDADGDTLTYSIASQGTKGTASVTSGQQLQYVPNLDANGGDSFTYKANDGSVDSSAATVSVTINPVNDPPTVKTAAADDKGKNEGATLSTQGAFQDTKDNDPLTITKGASDAGALVDNHDGTWSWSLQTNDNVSGTVTVTASDGKGGTVSDSFDYSTINVAPTATFNAPNSVNQGEQFQLSLTSANDASSVDKASLTYAFDCGDGSLGAPSTSSTANCTINTGGQPTVRGKVIDKDGGSNTYTAEVSVNSRPSAIANGPYNVDEGGSVPLSSNGSSDPDAGDTLTYAWDLNYDGTTFDTDATSASPNFSAANIDGDAARTVALKVTDNHGATSTVSTATVNIHNVAPSVNNLSGLTNVDENKNGSVPFTFSVSDPGNDTITTINADCGANGTKVSETNTSVNCRFADGATGTQSNVSVSATDDDGATGAAATKTVSIANVAPTVTLSGDTDVNEGTSSHHYGFTVTDPGADTHTVISHSCDSPQGNEVPGSFSYNDSTKQGSFDCTFPDGPVTAYVTATVRDDDGADDFDNKPVTVNVVNVAPTVTAPGPQSSDEGENHAFSLGSFTDPGSDSPWKVSVNWGDGSPVQPLTDATSTGSLGTVNHTYADGPATKTVNVTVTDKDGVSNTGSFQVTVNNLNPTIGAVTNTSGTINEGQSATISAANATDPAGANDPLSYSFDCNNNNVYTDAVDKGPQPTSSASCSFNDNGTYTVNVRVSDGDGGSDTGSATVTVNNVPPTATKVFDSSVDEGSSFTLKLTNPVDPSNADTTAGFQYRFDCGTGSGYGAWGTASSTSCPTTDNGTRNVKAEIRDKDSGSTEYTGTVTVNNANPAVGALSITDPNNGTACLSGNTVNLGFSFTDAGSADTHKATIAWGDGSTNTVVDPATSPVSGKQHTYSGLGPYTISVTVTDDDGGSGNGTKSQSFNYNIGNTLLSPVNLDNTSIFKLGSTIPLKVNITDCKGVGVTGLAPTIKMLLISSNPANTGEIEVTSTQPNDTNGIMRDVGGGQYMYNLASSSLPDSTAKYEAVVTHNGYKVTSQNYFSLKAK